MTTSARDVRKEKVRQYQAVLRAKRAELMICRDCKQRVPSGKRRCPDCMSVASKKAVERQKIKREKYKALGLCCECGGCVPEGRIACESCNERTKVSQRKLKDAVFAAYGGYVCACCGEEGREFLSIDHINNDGAEHRRSMGLNPGGTFYCWLKRNGFPPGFRVLCMNCNFARGRFGYCPHERQRAEPFPFVA